MREKNSMSDTALHIDRSNDFMFCYFPHLDLHLCVNLFNPNCSESENYLMTSTSFWCLTIKHLMYH